MLQYLNVVFCFLPSLSVRLLWVSPIKGVRKEGVCWKRCHVELEMSAVSNSKIISRFARTV